MNDFSAGVVVGMFIGILVMILVLMAMDLPFKKKVKWFGGKVVDVVTAIIITAFLAIYILSVFNREKSFEPPEIPATEKKLPEINWTWGKGKLSLMGK